MSVFDYQSFFETYNIHYVTSGKNQKKGELGLQCPWCGDSDPSQHLNVNPNTGVYGCWRNKSHSGRNPTKLVSKLLGVSWSEAAKITKEKNTVTTDDFGSRLNSMLSAPKDDRSGHREESIEWPDYLQPVERFGAGRWYVKYLESRGFDDGEIVSQLYGLRYGKENPWVQRVIFPLLDNRRKLVGWVGRSIREDAKIRYRALSKDEGAIRVTKEVVYRPFDIEQGGKVLYITEGPFDALKLDYYGHQKGLRATCLFGLNYSDSQVFALQRLAANFDQVRVMLDRNESMSAVPLVSALSCGASICSLPIGVKDPGSLKKNQVLELASGV